MLGASLFGGFAGLVTAANIEILKPERSNPAKYLLSALLSAAAVAIWLGFAIGMRIFFSHELPIRAG